MPSNSIIQLLCGIAILAIAWSTWWMKNNAERKKAIKDEDKKIDAITNADDVLIELDRLRQPPADRS